MNVVMYFVMNAVLAILGFVVAKVSLAYLIYADHYVNWKFWISFILFMAGMSLGVFFSTNFLLKIADSNFSFWDFVS